MKRDSKPFTDRVLSVVRRIPPGRVATYGDVAAMAGRPRAARAVGNIMRTCRKPGILPPGQSRRRAPRRLWGQQDDERARLARGVTVSGSRVRDSARSSAIGTAHMIWGLGLLTRRPDPAM
jgi:alkylated DNA nucleotide flippase Atl1